MDVEKAIAALEKYLREFIVYLVTFFRPTSKDEVYDDHENYNKSVLFAIFSTALGAYMWSRYILNERPITKDIFGLMVDNALKWLSFGMLLFLIIRLFRVQVAIVKTVITAVKVFSVAHILAIYAAYLVTNAVWGLDDPTNASKAALVMSAWTAYLLELGVVILYLPREVKELVGPEVTRRKRWPINTMFLTLLSILVLVPFGVWLEQQEAESAQVQ